MVDPPAQGSGRRLRLQRNDRWASFRRSIWPGSAVRRLVLVGTGALFALLWLSELIPATVTGQPPASLDVAGLVVNPTHVIDLSVVLPGVIVIGVLVLRGSEAGLALTLPAQVFSVPMGSSIIAAMVLIVASGDTSGLVAIVMAAGVVVASVAAAMAYSRGEAIPAGAGSQSEVATS